MALAVKQTVQPDCPPASRSAHALASKATTNVHSPSGLGTLRPRCAVSPEQT